MAKISAVLADLEYEAWQKVVHEWRNHPALSAIDFNGDDLLPLVAAIEFWGETLVALRQRQTPYQVNDAFISKSRRYTEKAT